MFYLMDTIDRDKIDEVKQTKYIRTENIYLKENTE